MWSGLRRGVSEIQDDHGHKVEPTHTIPAARGQHAGNRQMAHTWPPLDVFHSLPGPKTVCICQNNEEATPLALLGSVHLKCNVEHCSAVTKKQINMSD